jgi:hypothetical protein
MAMVAAIVISEVQKWQQLTSAHGVWQIAEYTTSKTRLTFLKFKITWTWIVASPWFAKLEGLTTVVDLSEALCVDLQPDQQSAAQLAIHLRVAWFITGPMAMTGQKPAPVRIRMLTLEYRMALFAVDVWVFGFYVGHILNFPIVHQAVARPPSWWQKGGILQSLSTTEDCSQGLESHRQGLVMGGMEQDGNNRSQVQGSCVESNCTRWISFYLLYLTREYARTLFRLSFDCIICILCQTSLCASCFIEHHRAIDISRSARVCLELAGGTWNVRTMFLLGTRCSELFLQYDA